MDNTELLDYLDWLHVVGLREAYMIIYYGRSERRNPKDKLLDQEIFEDYVIGNW